jgi:hypothetical protein
MATAQHRLWRRSDDCALRLRMQVQLVSNSTNDMRTWRSLWSQRTAPFLAVALLCGCGRSGPKRFEVSGHVTFDGAPLPDGEVVFTPDEATAGPTSVGAIENGAYDIPAERGPIAGNYSVAITAERSTGRKVKADILGDAMIDQYEQYIPDQYNSRTTLTAEIADDREDLDFTLSSGAAKR